MSKYLVHIVPAPAYTEPSFVISPAETDHANWIQYTKLNDTAGKKEPLNFSDENSSSLRAVPEFTIQPLDNSIETVKGSVEMSGNPSTSTGMAYRAYDALSVKESDRLEANEFSDHSDTEAFARLSESVFEAIEDTRDSVVDRRAQKAKTSKQTRTCPICGKIYTASSSYFYHMKHFHRQSKEHGCDVCGKKFGSRGDLQQHAAVHTDECKYACRSCHKQFRSRASWYIHEQIHEGVKKYKCPSCGKCFRWRTHLQRHASRHAADKKFQCVVCGRGFAVHCDLLRHARTHSVGSHECGECHAKFAQLRYLRAHVRKKHNKLE